MLTMVPRGFECVPLSLLLLSASFWACTDPGREAPSLSDIRLEQRPDQESWDVRFEVSDGDLPRVHIQAPYLGQYAEEDSTYMILEGMILEGAEAGADTVVAYLFDEAGDSSATLVADRIYYYEDHRRFEPRGRVRVTTVNGRQLETEHLIWYEDDRRIETSGFVRITTPEERIQGYDLDAAEDLSTYDLLRVTGRVTMEEGS